MRSTRCTIAPALMAALLPLLAPGRAIAQNATVDLAKQKQYIRGFGGMVHIPWIGDLNAAERTLAFGNAEGQLGFTVLRIAVPDGNTNVSSYVATAKAAIAAGGIVYASPWNSAGNMNSADFAAYADHLSSFVSHMKSQGAELYAISVQNEPDYGAQAGWRAWTAAQCHDFVLNYGDKIGTKLMSCESLNYTKSLYDPILNDPAALEKLGVLGTHLYGTSVNNFAYPLFDQKAAGKIERWMTEHYTDSNTDANVWPNALNVATELHNSMVRAQFNAYTWWYIKRNYGPINNGAVTKRGWCMAHWSKFVRPGYYRVDATESPTSGVSLSAYKGDKDVVIVAVNTNTSAKPVTISVAGADLTSYDRYTTSSSKSLAKEAAVTTSGGSLSVTLDAQSVTTLHASAAVTPGGTGGAGGAAGTGGAGGAGGTTGADAGRDVGPSRDVAGASGPEAGTDSRTRADAVAADLVGDAARVETGAGDNPGTGGVAGSGGAGAGGDAGGGRTGSSGSVASGGAQGTGGAAAVAADPESGCACALGRPGRGGLTWTLIGLLPLFVWSLRRRRRP